MMSVMAQVPLLLSGIRGVHVINWEMHTSISGKVLGRSPLKVVTNKSKNRCSSVNVGKFA